MFGVDLYESSSETIIMVLPVSKQDCFWNCSKMFSFRDLLAFDVKRYLFGIIFMQQCDAVCQIRLFLKPEVFFFKDKLPDKIVLALFAIPKLASN